MLLSTPFLTELDSRAAVKGSRDPLGVQPIWARMGRQVVGNLTTVSTSVRDFTATMLGYYLAELVAAEEGSSDDLNVFLRWEQLAAYARGGGNDDWEFRGTERTKKNWSESDRIRLATDPSALILSDQKTYGLWGLYTVPTRSSGLLEESPARLTPEARKFVETHYWPVLGGRSLAQGKGLVHLLARRSIDLRPRDRDKDAFEAVAKVLLRKFSLAERNFYLKHLVNGGPHDSTKGLQRILAQAMRETLATIDWKLSASSVRHLAKRCQAAGSEAGNRAAGFLEDIRSTELLLAPCTACFAFVLGQDGQDLMSVAGRIRKQWGPKVSTVNAEALTARERELRDSSGEAASSRRWLNVAQALSEGDYASVVNGLIDQNRAVMDQRGGAAPWVEIRDRRLHVRFVAENASELPSKSALPQHWAHSYFLDSLRSVTAQLEA
jgi:hypothetical protein